jgi:hypothetical protein
MDERNLEALGNSRLSSSSSTLSSSSWLAALGLIGAPGIGMEKVRRNGDEAMWRGGGGVVEFQKVESLIASSNYCFFFFFCYF